MKRIVLSSLVVVVFTAIVFSQHLDNYSYHPYPVVLVHGYSQIPVEPFGLPTYKEALEVDSNSRIGHVKKKMDQVLSTQIDTSLAAFEKDRLGWIMIEAFGADTTNGQKSYWDYQVVRKGPQDSGSIGHYFDTLKSNRFYPHEDSVASSLQNNNPHNYTGLNHSFVELYCNYFQFESNDGNSENDNPDLSTGYSKAGVKHPQFNAYGVSAKDSSGAINDIGYNVIDGGQSQILRIRLIQALNEYYGDFKWLNDPSAKINVVAYSNGGTVITWMLQDDERWYSAYGDGNNKRGISLSSLVDGTSDIEKEVIDGFGVRLREHINQVITIDSPFKGVPWSWKEGYDTSPARRTFVAAGAFLISGIGATIVLSANPAIKTGLMTGTIPLIAAWNMVLGVTITTGIAGGIVGAVAYGNQYESDYEPEGDGHTPLAYDVHPKSDFNKRFKGDGIQPLYLNGDIIPYTNMVGVMGNAGKFFYGFGALFGAFGIATAIPPCPLFDPAASAAMFSLMAPCFMIGHWYSNSDFIVSAESQQMTTPYPNAQVRKVIHHKKNARGVSAFHVAIIKGKANKVPELVDRFPPTLEVTHAIGSFQYDTLKLQSGDSVFCANDIPTTTVQNDSTKWNENLRGAPFKKGVRFDYMTKNHVDENEAWPISKGDKIVTNGTIGPPAYIVGKLNSYYMNRTKLEVRVNIDQWSEVDFYKDTGNGEFGNYASMYVDMNGDSVIDEADGDQLSQLNFKNVTGVTA